MSVATSSHEKGTFFTFRGRKIVSGRIDSKEEGKGVRVPQKSKEKKGRREDEAGWPHNLR